MLRQLRAFRDTARHLPSHTNTSAQSALAQQRRWKARRVYICTETAAFKLDEYKSHFNSYGIDVAAAPKPAGIAKWSDISEEQLAEHAKKLLAEANDAYWVKAVIKEDQTLMKYGTEIPATLEDNECVTIQANMRAYHFPMSEQKKMREMSALSLRHPGQEDEAGEVEVDTSNQTLLHDDYTAKAEAYVSLASRRSSQTDSADPAVFGWDDIVVSKGTSLSFQDKKLMGCKVSPRDIVVDGYIAQHIHYKKRKDMNWTEIEKAERTIHFGESSRVREFIASNKYLNNPVAEKSGLSNFFRAVANNGTFFRAAKTRREANYWLPGLNAGLPLTAKRDPIHEITFTAHDLGHFLLPDLVFIGNRSPTIRRTYIIYRMLSEATTMILADMIFTETLRRAGFEYDYAKRKIHPLFVDAGIDPFGPDGRIDTDAVRQLLEANVAYCLLGDTSKWAELAAAHAERSGKSAEEVAAYRRGDFDSLNNFKDKYMPFFVEDYKWTEKNFSNMESRAEQFQRWWKLVEPVRKAAGLDGLNDGIGLESVDEFASAIKATSAVDGADLVQRCFDRVFATRIEPALKPGGCGEELADDLTIRTRAFARYMLGQMNLFARYPFLQETEIYSSQLVRSLVHELPKGITPEKASNARSLYEQYIRCLLEKGMLSMDDAENFKEVCPLFEPFFVFYDEEKDSYQQLSDVQADILGFDSKDSPGKASNGLGLPTLLQWLGPNRIPVMDAESWWQSVHHVDTKSKLRGLLEAGGVEFWDDQHNFVKRPMVSLCAVGGFPLRRSMTGRSIRLAVGSMGAPLDMQNLTDALRSQMGLLSFPTYLNPRNKSPPEMFNIICKDKHFSVGHGAMLSLALLGHSSAVENELNSQRDIVHLARLTVARTAAQRDPPIVVQNPDLLPLYKRIRDTTEACVDEARRPADCSAGDWQEALHTAWPAGKAQIAIVTGSLRNFQKLVGALEDTGKEAEYLAVLWQLNGVLHSVMPDMFKPNDAYDFVPPEHQR